MTAPYVYCALGGFCGGVAFGRHWPILVAAVLVCVAAALICRGFVLMCGGGRHA